MLRYYRKKLDFIAVMFFICLFVLVIALSSMVLYFVQNGLNKNKMNQLNIVAEEEVETLKDSTDRYESVRDKYPDLAGFVTYRYYGKKVRLPLMQTKDNDYYLYRDVEGKSSKAGTPFIDYRCDVENSLLLVLYAHNMKDLSMFGALKEYKSEAYCKKYPYLYFETQYKKKAKYEIVAAFYSEIYPEDKDVFRYYAYFDLETKADYDYYLYNIRRLAEYDTGVRPLFGEKLILLSTCDYTRHKENGRFAVLAREVKAVPTPKSYVTPTVKPSVEEERTTKEPTSSHDVRETAKATRRPTKQPASQSTKKPTKAPTIAPTKKATKSPTKSPTKAPTKAPTVAPTKTPLPSPTMPEI